MTDYTKMPFADGQFDIVINRHGNYNANEIFRILKPNGLFITQLGLFVNNFLQKFTLYS